MATRRTTPGRAEPKRPELVGALLEGARVKTSQAAGRAVDPERWQLAVGARIARSTTPGRLVQGVLTVNVASAVWAQELSLLERELIARLARVGLVVRSLRFRVSPQTRRAPLAAPRARRPAPPPAPLPAELEARLAAIEDPELRAVIAEAAGHSLAQRRRAGVTSPKPPARAPLSGAKESDRRDRAEARSPAGTRRNSARGPGRGR